MRGRAERLGEEHAAPLHQPARAPREGDIYLEGRSICRGPEAPAGEAGWELDYVRQRVGIVFQQFNLFPHRTALQNVTMAPEKVLGRSKEEAREKGTGLLERVGLADKLDHTLNGSPVASSSGSRSPARWRWTLT